MRRFTAGPPSSRRRTKSWAQRVRLNGTRTAKGLRWVSEVLLAAARKAAGHQPGSTHRGAQPLGQGRTGTPRLVWKPRTRTPTFREAAYKVHTAKVNAGQLTSPKHRANWIQVLVQSTHSQSLAICPLTKYPNGKSRGFWNHWQSTAVRVNRGCRRLRGGPAPECGRSSKTPFKRNTSLSTYPSSCHKSGPLRNCKPRQDIPPRCRPSPRRPDRVRAESASQRPSGWRCRRTCKATCSRTRSTS